MGWYRKSEICFIYHSDWLSYFQAEQRVVAIKAKADLWQNSSATRYLTYCRMGTSFPLVGEVGDYYQIQVPQSDGFGTAFIAKGDAHIGYLPYTARNIYQQAFRMLGVAYGWGDMRGDFDCSSLLKHLFSCFGIFLPRNGLQQAKAASLLYEFALRDSEAYRDSIIVNTAMPAATLLRLSGHIMLYLGSYQGKPFALHNIWGYRKPDETGKDQVFVINKTTISDLSLGANSKRGSLLQRVTMLSAIK